MAQRPFKVKSLKVGNTAGLDNNVTVEFLATDGVRMPSGNTGQRPTGADGVFRYNTETAKFEGYSNASWIEVATGTIGEFGNVIVNNALTSNTISVGNSTQNTTIDSTSITVNSLSVSNTFKVPAGNTGQRPATVNGHFYHNTETKRFEGVANGAWFNIPDEARLILIDEAQALTAAQKKQVLQNAGVIQVAEVADANYTMANTDLVLYPNAAITTTRTWTLPAAASVPAGWTIDVIDIQGRIGSSNNINIVRAGADTLNGGTTTTLRRAYDRVKLWSDGVSRWFTISDEALLSKILQVDGSGSGLDADVLRGTTPGTGGLAVLDDATTNAIHTTLGVYPTSVFSTSGSGSPLIVSPTTPIINVAFTATGTRALVVTTGTILNQTASLNTGGMRAGMHSFSVAGWTYTPAAAGYFGAASSSYAIDGLTVGSTHRYTMWGYFGGTPAQMYVHYTTCSCF